MLKFERNQLKMIETCKLMIDDNGVV